jgi:hypothetical protein
MSAELRNFSPRQRALLDQWLPGASVERAQGWGLVETTVLEMTHGGSRFIVKAGGSSDHHIDREIHAHVNWLLPWTSRGRAPALKHADAEAKLLVTRYLPGELVLGSAHAGAPATYRQAGNLLALLHAQAAVTDEGYERRENEKSLAWLADPHRIAPSMVEQLQAEIAKWPRPTATLVPTHGDWQPGTGSSRTTSSVSSTSAVPLCVPALTDCARLAAQDFRYDPDLEAAFLDGYGTDPRESDAWHRTRIREAIGTAAWAYRVRAEEFEAQGHRMLAEAFAAS